MGKIYDKLGNKIGDLCFKVIHFICINFTNVNFGKLDTVSCFKVETSKLRKKNKGIAYTFSL